MLLKKNLLFNVNNLIETYIIGTITIIKYQNGIMEQFGFINYNDDFYVQFPIRFDSKVCPMIHIATHSVNPISFSIRNPNTVSFWLSFNSKPSKENLFFRAIGYWK